MAGYKTRTSWSAPDIKFDADGKRIREPKLLPLSEDGIQRCDGDGEENCVCRP